jgi:hypothetical protein
VRRLPLRTDSARYSLASPTVPQGSATLIRRAGLRARIWRATPKPSDRRARHYERDWLGPRAHSLHACLATGLMLRAEGDRPLGG